MASKRYFAKMKREPKFSTRRQNRCEITGRKRYLPEVPGEQDHARELALKYDLRHAQGNW